jgi:Arc/MetJ-type ribon-helix-helix transcriptional regulator
MVKEKYVFSPDVVDIKKIDKVIEKIDRYGSRDEFLRESIDLITMWWLTPKEMFVKVQEMWADYTPEMKRETKENSPEFYEKMENPTGQVTKKLSYLEEFAKEVQRNRDILEKEESPICKECIPSNNPPLMNKLHTRFFPAKIVICILAEAVTENINVNNNKWIDYESFRKNSFDEVLGITKILKRYEEENKVTRSKRISTGLPSFHEKTFEDKEEELKNSIKIKASKERFLEQFVGPTFRAFKQNTKSITISGILNNMGLVHIRETEHNSLEITLSSDGIEFLSLPNPIIDSQDLSHSISNHEKKFILEKVIPKFDLEDKIVDAILITVNKNENSTATNIDDLIDPVKTKWCKNKFNSQKIKDYKIERVDQDYWKNVRISIMGRLSEIGSVDWTIEGGVSKYQAPKPVKITK